MFGIAELLKVIKVHVDPGREGFGADVVHLGQFVFVVGFDFWQFLILKGDRHELFFYQWLIVTRVYYKKSDVTF